MIKNMVVRILVGIVAMLSVFLSSSLSVFAQEMDHEITKKEADEKLKDVFPELEGIIDKANENKTGSKMACASDEIKVVYRDSKEINSQETIGIAIMSDGSYAAYSLIGSKKWVYGSVSSGTGYMNKENASLTVWQTLGLYTMTVYPVSFSFVNNGYDGFMNTGVATINGSMITAYPVKMKETAASPAYAYYNATNQSASGTSIGFQVKITVGNDQVKVYLNESEI